MTVQELIAALSTLPLDMYVCGISHDESIGLFSGGSTVHTADAWHDALPAGAKYVNLEFNNVIPHIYGEGAFTQKVPPPVVEWQQECQFCDYTLRSTSHTHCKKCSWLPMLQIVGKYTDGQYEAQPRPPILHTHTPT